MRCNLNYPTTSRRVPPRVNACDRPLCAAGDPAAVRPAFTLVEILVVISIIALLMTLTVGVIGAFLDNARHAATTATLTKVQALMNSRRQAFDRLLQRKGFVTNSYEYQFAQSWSQAKGVTIPSSAIRPIAIKLLQMKYFPQSAADLNFLMVQVYSTPQSQLQLANMYPNLFQSFVNNPAGFQAPATVPNLTNQEILYNILTENVIGDTPLGADAFTAVEVVQEPPSAAPQTAGLPFFIDAWKGPIRYYRWPTRLFRNDGLNITTADIANAKVVFSALPVFSGNLQNDLARDPDDPLGACAQISGFVFEDYFHTPQTYHIPVIMSAGPDGQFGLGSPDDKQLPGTQQTYGYLGILNPAVTPSAAAFDQLSDNLVSASLKAGGK
ncbi:MAG: type II secretion system protein [Planctomycetes bacterium]|nr:type II secretion system protein [Planctomycetota bacterium]